MVDDEKEHPGQMAYAYKMTWIWAISLSIVIFVLWPLLALPAGIFSQGYFTFWIILSLVSSSALKLPILFARCLKPADVVVNNMHVCVKAHVSALLCAQIMSRSVKT